MKKLLLSLLLAVLAYQPAFGADTKLADLTATTTPVGTDILYIVVDPGGTPLDRKITLANFFATPSPTLVTPILGVAAATSVTATGLLQAGTTIGISTDVLLHRDAAGILAQRNGANAQAFHVYNTYTDASNYERAFLSWSKTAQRLVFGTEGAGTGTARSFTLSSYDLDLKLDGTSRWLFRAEGHLRTVADNVYDIGASGATRPRDYYGAGKITSAGATAGIGYATGAGGTVTQITSRSTGVTLNKVSGQITTTADSIAAITIVTFTVTNSAVAATDTIILSKVSGDVDTSAWVSAVAAGSFNISLRNNDAVSADTTAFVLNFAVIKSVTS